MEKTLYRDRAACKITFFSLVLVVKVVTQVLQWLTPKNDKNIIHAVILTNLMNLQQKAESRMGCLVRYATIHRLGLQRFQRIYWPGQAGVRGNTRNGQGEWTSHMSWKPGKAEILQCLRKFLRKNRPTCHSTDYLTERTVGKKKKKRSSCCSTIGGQKQSVLNQTNTGTILKASFRRFKEWAGACMALPKQQDALLGWHWTMQDSSAQPQCQGKLMQCKQFKIFFQWL